MTRRSRWSRRDGGRFQGDAKVSRAPGPAHARLSRPKGQQVQLVPCGGASGPTGPEPTSSCWDCRQAVRTQSRKTLRLPARAVAEIADHVGDPFLFNPGGRRASYPSQFWVPAGACGEGYPWDSDRERSRQPGTSTRSLSLASSPPSSPPRRVGHLRGDGLRRPPHSRARAPLAGAARAVAPS